MARMTEYYKTQLERGILYQDFVYEILSRNGINTVAYGSRLFQYRFGENKAGIEIKYDDKFKDSRNLWIEVSEKSNPKNIEYIESGIYRECTEYIIGDYNTIFRMATNVLRRVVEGGRFRIIENNMKTSKGFLLPCTEAARISIAVYHPGLNDQIKDFIESDSMDRETAKQKALELLSAMKCNPSQINLFDCAVG